MEGASSSSAWPSKDDPPFELHYAFHPDDSSSIGKYSCVATFPWDAESINELWKGQLAKHDGTRKYRQNMSEWNEACKKYAGAFAVGSIKGSVEIWVVDINAKEPVGILLAVNLNEYGSITAVAWAFSPDFLKTPFVVAAAHQHVFVIDCENASIVSTFRGHGNKVSAIAVHPVYPNILCTTSYDNTSRVYDLKLPARTEIQTRPWPYTPANNRGAPPHGDQMIGEEEGLGRCVTILMGGRSGGHKAPVLCAAFHPVDPIVVTGSMDRRIKIWPLIQVFDSDISDLHANNHNGPVPVVDKPIFSSGKLHPARVLSVAWLHRGHLLLSHSAPAHMRERVSSLAHDPNFTQPEGEEEEEAQFEYYMEPGIICLWRWLSAPRFFPGFRDDGVKPKTSMRGCASDWQESSSFQTVAKVQLPMNALFMHVHYSGPYTPFILVPLPDSYGLCLVYLTDFPTDLGAGPFQLNKDEATEEELLEYQHALEHHRVGTKLDRIPSFRLPTERIDHAQTQPSTGDVRACQVGARGRMIVAVGDCGVRILLM